jgi:hypothetical protein
MAGRVELNPGSGGKGVAVDQVGSSPTDRNYQYVKIVDGTTGSELPIGGDATYGLYVDIKRSPKASAANETGSPFLAPATGTSVGNIALRAIAAEPSRKRVELVNTSDTATIYVKLASYLTATVSTSSYHLRLMPSQSWWDDIYTGEIIAVHDGSTGTQPLGVIQLT